MSNYITSKETDYSVHKSIKPKYKFVKVPLYNITSSSITIGPTTNTQLEFKLPTLVYNLYRSYLEYNVNIPSVVPAGNPDPIRIATHEDVFDLGGSLSFGAAGGLDIVNLQWAQNYTKIRRKIDTSLDDMLTNDETSGLYPCHVAAQANIVPYTTEAPRSPAGITYSGVVSNLENTYINLQDTAATANRYRRYPLGSFSGTLFGVDRDFYAGNQEMYLRINAGTGDKMAFTTTTTGTNVSKDAASAPSLTINNVYLWLCVEDNLDIVNEFHSKFNSGALKYTIPYTASFKMPGSASGPVNHTIQLSQQYGKRLKRIMGTVWNKNERFNTAYDCNNWNGCKITSYRTWMNNIPLQDRQLSCRSPADGVLNSDDWLENKKFISKGSSILNRKHYALNWFHMDQFFEPHDRKTDLPEINVDEGLAMDRPHTYLFNAEINSDAASGGEGANSIFYFYAEFTREIAATPEGIIFMAS